MEYQKIVNLLDNTSNQPSKFRTKKSIEINDESQKTYNEDNQIRFKISTLRSCLCNYSDAYILAKGTTTVTNIPAENQPNNGTNKEAILKKFALFTNCICRTNNT